MAAAREAPFQTPEREASAPEAPRVLYLYAQVLRAHSPHARQTFQMLSLMKRAGLQVDVLTLPRGDAWPTGLVRRVYRTGAVPFVRGLPYYGGGFRRTWATVVMTLSALRLFLMGRYRAVHCADRSVRVGAVVAWLFGARFIFEWRSRSGHSLIKWARKRSRRFLRSVNLVLADEQLDVARLRQCRLYGRIAYLPALPAPWVRPLPLPAVRLGGTQQRFTLAALSFRPDGRDWEVLLEALGAFSAHVGLGVRFYGGTGAAVERLRAHLAEKLPRALEWAIEPFPEGSVALQRALLPADAVFFPALSGAVPPPELLDAMASRRALLAIRCPAAETVLPPAGAIWVRSERTAIAEALERAMRAPTLCIDKAQAAADALAQERSLEAVTEALRSCYAFALAPGGA